MYYTKKQFARVFMKSEGINGNQAVFRIFGTEDGHAYASNT